MILFWECQPHEPASFLPTGLFWIFWRVNITLSKALYIMCITAAYWLVRLASNSGKLFGVWLDGKKRGTRLRHSFYP